jgi:hypothetical protein
MTERIEDECIYLRINELKKGNIQFTDATNAKRLYRNTVKIYATIRREKNG